MKVIQFSVVVVFVEDEEKVLVIHNGKCLCL